MAADQKSALKVKMSTRECQQQVRTKTGQGINCRSRVQNGELRVGSLREITV